ncbi:cytosine permease [Avibacterium sp. 20-15]|uniref:cytosine permease n=1 Tax=unclassified Avibacterium TaxID=2685287 RepID=UPI002026E3C2|nr:MULTISPECIES: cytosine permease [unclassified Avibacterium]MCW9732950.1 cytosine permease [Avibacterium sp. 20-15]URL05084.1 cytosine permease [Avibacterium sp. 20-132]
MTNRNNNADAPYASAIQIVMILLGILITPALLASSSLGSQLPFSKMVFVIMVGSIILSLLAAINMSIGVKARLPTYGLIKFSFGSQGAIAINLIMAISLLGWIIVTANMFGHTVQDFLSTQFQLMLPLPLLVLLGCLIFVGATAFGFEFLSRIAKWAVPIITLLMFFILYLTLKSNFSPSKVVHTMSIGEGISSVVGTIIVLVTTSVDFGSFTKNKKHACIAGILTFAIAYPLLFLIGAVPSALTDKNSLLDAMLIIGSLLPAYIILIFACITGNAGNMFQGTLVFSTLLPQFPKWKITLTLGVITALVGSIDIMGLFIPFLLFLGIATPPICGIYITDYFINRKNGYNEDHINDEEKIKYPAFIAWAVGALVGFLTVKGFFTLTYIPPIDSILVASLCYLLLIKIVKK